MGQRSSRATTPKTWLEPLRILLGLVHQRRSSDLFGSLVDALTAKLKDRTKWAMKVGKHNSPNVGNCFGNYKVADPHNIRLGLTVSCANIYRLERAVQSVLNNRGSEINEEGSEWYLTNIDEVLEILRFQCLIG